MTFFFISLEVQFFYCMQALCIKLEVENKRMCLYLNRNEKKMREEDNKFLTDSQLECSSHSQRT